MANTPHTKSGLEITGNLILLGGGLVAVIVVFIGVLGLFGVGRVSLQSRAVTGANWTDTGLRTLLTGLGVAVFIALHGLALRALGRRRALRTAGAPVRPMPVGAFIALVVGGGIAVLVYLVAIASFVGWMMAPA